jgi:hypothetical protein
VSQVDRLDVRERDVYVAGHVPRRSQATSASGASSWTR